jgi:hypothetical protein
VPERSVHQAACISSGAGRYSLLLEGRSRVPGIAAVAASSVTRRSKRRCRSRAAGSQRPWSVLHTQPVLHAAQQAPVAWR